MANGRNLKLSALTNLHNDRICGKLFRNIGPWLAVFLACVLLLAGCRAEPVVGPVDAGAPVALIRFESQEDGISGVVYRRINRFDAFLAQSDTPVLVVFYNSMSPVNQLIIPMLEQMADDKQGKLQIVWIDAGKETKIAESFGVETLPQFTVVVGASLKRSLIGYDDEGQVRIEKLLEPYLP
jgi:thiol-disulfide isomerase/thioredoxin